MTKIKLLAVDLDGTLLSDNKTISEIDLNVLVEIGKMHTIRVAATGRSLFKVKEVLPESTPIDYVVFSSGAGVYDWQNKRLLQREYFDSETVKELISHLLGGNYNFFVYQPIPENNLFHFHRGADVCPEFENYLERHNGDFKEFSNEVKPGAAGQFMAIIRNDGKLFDNLKNEILTDCPNVKVIRTTSPINDRYIWLEIFPNTVSKGHGIKWLCDYLKIDYSQTLGIGNDYNDVDMFDFVAYPYVVGNGIEELKNKYQTVSETNNESVVSVILKSLFSDH